MTKEAKKVFDKFFKIHRDNVAGKTICFISRGEWSDPQIAYKGYLLNYCIVLDADNFSGEVIEIEPDQEYWRESEEDDSAALQHID